MHLLRGLAHPTTIFVLMGPVVFAEPPCVPREQRQELFHLLNKSYDQQELENENSKINQRLLTIRREIEVGILSSKVDPVTQIYLSAERDLLESSKADYNHSDYVLAFEQALELGNVKVAKALALKTETLKLSQKLAREAIRTGNIEFINLFSDPRSRQHAAVLPLRSGHFEIRANLTTMKPIDPFLRGSAYTRLFKIEHSASKDTTGSRGIEVPLSRKVHSYQVHDEMQSELRLESSVPLERDAEYLLVIDVGQNEIPLIFSFKAQSAD